MTPRTEMTPSTLLADLRGIVGSEHAFAPEDERKFAVDEMNPVAVVEPGSYQEVSAVMRLANESRLAVIPRGCGGRFSFGNVPSRYDIALNLRRLNQIIEYEPADLTVTCQAGATLEGLHERLGPEGQMVPFGPVGGSSVGGLLAVKRSLPNLSYGAARDFTIGMRVVTADGRIVRAGGRVVKNVAGYDLCKLFIGSLGTLGVIVEATFKLAPLPEARKRLALKFASVGEACWFAWALQEQGLSLWNVTISRPMMLERTGPQSHGFFVLWIELAGTSAGVARSTAEIERLNRDIQAERYDPATLPNGSGETPSWASGYPLTCTVSVLPSRVGGLVEEIDREGMTAYLDVSPLAGSVTATWLGAGTAEHLVERTSRVARRAGAAVTEIMCHPDLKRRIDVFGDPPPSFPLMRAIKQQFDPNGILSPGRFVGRL